MLQYREQEKHNFTGEGGEQYDTENDTYSSSQSSF